MLENFDGHDNLRLCRSFATHDSAGFSTVPHRYVSLFNSSAQILMELGLNDNKDALPVRIETPPMKMLASHSIKKCLLRTAPKDFRSGVNAKEDIPSRYGSDSLTLAQCVARTISRTVIRSSFESSPTLAVRFRDSEMTPQQFSCRLIVQHWLIDPLRSVV